MAILLEIREGTLWCIDRQMGEIRSAQAFQLGVEIGKIAALQQGVIAEINPRRNILRHECDLLGLCKKLSGIRSSTRRPIAFGGNISSGMILVGSSTSKSKLSANS